jgi:hypothetical protein
MFRFSDVLLQFFDEVRQDSGANAPTVDGACYESIITMCLERWEKKTQAVDGSDPLSHAFCLLKEMREKGRVRMSNTINNLLNDSSCRYVTDNRNCHGICRCLCGASWSCGKGGKEGEGFETAEKTEFVASKHSCSKYWY